jgi:hypothetical protein
VGGLGLLALGGCFLVGVMMLVAPSTMGGTPFLASLGTNALLAILYALAIACLIGAFGILAIALRKLLKLLS